MFLVTFRTPKIRRSWAPVAHTCNPSYLGGWDQEDHGLNPAEENSSLNPISKNHQSKIEWRCGSRNKAPALQEWGPEFKPVPPKKKEEIPNCSQSTENLMWTGLRVRLNSDFSWRFDLDFCVQSNYGWDEEQIETPSAVRGRTQESFPELGWVHFLNVRLLSRHLELQGWAWWFTVVIPVTEIRQQRLGGSWFEASSGRKVTTNPSQPTSQAWWFISIIPAA
jgi:hypothetical protein